MAISITPSPFGSVTVTLDGELGGVLSVGVLATSNSALNMDLGVPGPAGEAGEPGSNGQGVAPGGLINQVLVKLSNDDFDTGWADGGAGGDFLPLAGGTMSGTIFLPSLRNLLNTDLTVTAYNDTGAGTNFVHTFDAFDGTFSLATNGGGLIFPDATVQATAYDPAVLGNYLPLTGGTMTGAVTITNGAVDPSFVTYNYNGLSIGGNQNNLNLSEAYGLDFNGIGGGDGTMGYRQEFIKFADNSEQSTAFPPTGGLVTEYITGTGSLVTFPPVGDRYFTTSNSTLTCDSGNGKTMTVGTGVILLAPTRHHGVLR